MSKLIKKAQSGTSLWGQASSLLPNTERQITSDFMSKLGGISKLPQFSGATVDPMILGKLNLTPPKLTDMSPASAGGSVISKGFGKGFGQVKSGLIGAIPDAVDGAANLIGTRASVQSGGEAAFSKISSAALKGAIKTGNPYAIAGAAVLKGLDLVNQFGGKSSQKQGTLGMNTGPYSQKVSTLAGQKFTLLGRSKRKATDRFTNRANFANMKAGQSSYLGKQDMVAATNSYNDTASRNEQSLYGGVNTQLLSAKLGTKINLNKIIKRVQSHKNGGTLNVIPDGALHARNHALPEELKDDITKKGIPVITVANEGDVIEYENDGVTPKEFAKGGEITQHAEIEKNEIIFTKEVTDKLEDFLEQHKNAENDKERSEIAIACGKFITEEILENTDDRTGLLNEVD